MGLQLAGVARGRAGRGGLHLTSAGVERERSNMVVGIGERREKPEIVGERGVPHYGIGMSDLLDGV